MSYARTTDQLAVASEVVLKHISGGDGGVAILGGALENSALSCATPAGECRWGAIDNLDARNSLVVTDGVSTLSLSTGPCIVVATTGGVGSSLSVAPASVSALVGVADTNATIDTGSSGSVCHGHCVGDGSNQSKLSALSQGSLIGGVTDGGGQILAPASSAGSSICHGHCVGASSKIQSLSSAGIVVGHCSGGSNQTTGMSGVTCGRGALVIGHADGGSTMFAGSNGTNSGSGALVHGVVLAPAGSVSASGVSTNTSSGALVGGYSNSGFISANGTSNNNAMGSLVHGYASSATLISYGQGSNVARGSAIVGSCESATMTVGSATTSTSDTARGALVFGDAQSSGKIMATQVTGTGVDVARAATVGGSASNGGTIQAFGSATNNARGSLVVGTSIGSGSAVNCGGTVGGATIGLGSFVGGHAESAGVIRSSTGTQTIGSIARGTASSSGAINVAQSGAVALGYASGSGALISATGGLACGHAISTSPRIGTISATNATSACVFGLVDASSGNNLLTSTSFGSVTFGCVQNTATSLSAIGHGSWASGRVFNGAAMFASGGASMITGYSESTSTPSIGNVGAGSLMLVRNPSGNTGSFTNNGPGSIVCGTSLVMPSANSSCLFVGKYATALTTKAITDPMLGALTVNGTASIQIGAGLPGQTTNASVAVMIGTSSFGAAAFGGGVANVWSTSGADYAEMFEWADANTGAEDRTGVFVTLSSVGAEAGKIHACSDDQVQPLGISAHRLSPCGMIGDLAAFRWSGKALRDELGRRQIRYEYRTALEDYCVREGVNTETFIETPRVYAEDGETVEVEEQLGTRLSAAFVAQMDALDDDDPQLFALVPDLPPSVTPLPCTRVNPDFDEQQVYVPRIERAEWTPVSLLGKVYMKDDGTCVPGQRCKAGAGGVATLSTNVGDPYTYHVMKRVSPYTICVFVK